MTTLRLAGVLVDVPASDHARAVEFWSAALGQAPVVPEHAPEYADFEDVTPGVFFSVQATQDGTRRVHIDFASPDRDGAVDQLSRFGATVLGRGGHWVVMNDPAGTTFCVVDGEAGSGE